ncbi:SMC-Scp complex subunit ScpB [Mechercharimyces sp. CAU 1602]|uniref:SMC-Scp complex subunit ScpB n=1 Tax=Mechercharimyces sp. CAU 1602 TaxID=2973933 RepID=UPI0037CBCE57
MEKKPIIEGMLLAAGEEGLTARELGEVLELSTKEVRTLIEDLQMEWKASGRGMQIVRVADAYQLTTLAEHAPYLSKMASSSQRAQMSRAALETLAIIAYRQPITRMEIEEVRGVKCDKTIQSLVRKGLIRDVGRAEGLGRPILYGTSKSFLEYFGLSHLQELPEPDSLFEWAEWEHEREALYQRLGVGREQEVLLDTTHTPDEEA